MNIFLEQYEETIGKITYHDITQISVLENHDETIHNLPNQLTQLFMMSSMCTNIHLTNCVNLTSLIIIHSNLRTFPDISACTKLKICQLTQSALTRFSPPFELPSGSLEMFNLQGNLITNTEFTYNKLEKIKKTNLSDNHLKYDLFPEKIRLKSNLVRQGTYIHNPINHRNVQIANIRNHIQTLGTDTQLFASQNVHLSSINKSVLQSVEVLETMVKNQKIPIEKVDDFCYGYSLDKQVKVLKKCCNKYNKYKYLDGYIENILKDHLKCATVHGVTKKTYKQTFELIWSILCFQHSHQKVQIDDAFERIATELIDGHKLCFTGRYNRLLNSIVGIIDGVQVGFSENEQLQLEFGIIIQKFNLEKENPKENRKYTFDNLYCDAKDILDLVKDENVKQVWMDALLDLSPDPTKIDYNGTTYLQTWDDDILNIYDKTLEGYWLNDKIHFLTEFDGMGWIDKK
jgi:hypothetical protein